MYNKKELHKPKELSAPAWYIIHTNLKINQMRETQLVNIDILDPNPYASLIKAWPVTLLPVMTEKTNCNVIV